MIKNKFYGTFLNKTLRKDACQEHEKRHACRCGGDKRAEERDERQPDEKKVGDGKQPASSCRIGGKHVGLHAQKMKP